MFVIHYITPLAYIINTSHRRSHSKYNLNPSVTEVLSNFQPAFEADTSKRGQSRASFFSAFTSTSFTISISSTSLCCFDVDSISRPTKHACRYAFATSLLLHSESNASNMRRL